MNSMYGDNLTYGEELLFKEGVEFTEEYYQSVLVKVLLQMDELKEKLTQNKVKLEEIKGGIYYGK